MDTCDLVGACCADSSNTNEVNTMHLLDAVWMTCAATMITTINDVLHIYDYIFLSAMKGSKDAEV